MKEANQSSFRANNFCENQLQSISRKIHAGFDSNLSLKEVMILAQTLLTELGMRICYINLKL